MNEQAQCDERVRRNRVRAAQLEKEIKAAWELKHLAAAARAPASPAALSAATTMEKSMGTTNATSDEPTAAEKQTIFEEMVIKARLSRQAAAAGLGKGVAPTGAGISSDSHLAAYDPHEIARLARAHIEEMEAKGVEVSDAEAVRHILSQPALVMSAVPAPRAGDDRQEAAAAEDALALARAHDISSRARVYTAQMAAIGIEVTATEAVRHVLEQK
jgi:hypothetical protein